MTNMREFKKSQIVSSSSMWSLTSSSSDSYKRTSQRNYCHRERGREQMHIDQMMVLTLRFD